MPRSWLLTSTTYGTWLPGDDRGFVGTVRDLRPEDYTDGEPALTRVRHNIGDTPYDRDLRGLRAAAARQMKGDPVFFTRDRAAVVLKQMRETAAHRGWELHAVAVMRSHFHAVVTADDETSSAKILQDLKAYAARALNRRWPRPASGTWWTESGSKRPLPNEEALGGAISYVRDQPGVLALWVEGSSTPPERGA